MGFVLLIAGLLGIDGTCRVPHRMIEKGKASTLSSEPSFFCLSPFGEAFGELPAS
jgi:hypothetical protein